jgi:hypothetical protein
MNPQKNNNAMASIGDSQRQLRVFKDNKGNHDRESGQDNEDANG